MGPKAKRRRKTSKIQRREPQQPRARATVAAILEAAARIIRRDGLAGLNTNRLAERTGISVGTLYGYFPDKTAILVALARSILQEDEAALLAAAEEAAAGQAVRAVVRALIARHSTDPALRRAVMAVHIGEGHGAEHADRVERFVAVLVGRAGLADLDDLRLFVVTRAALGIARSLTDEGTVGRFGETEIEEQVMRLIEGYAGAAVAGSPA